MNRLRVRRIELAVPDAASGTHSLHIARSDGRSIAHGVLVGQLTGQNIADDFHIAMAVSAKAGSSLYAILVDHTQGSELNMLRVIVVGK